MATPSGPAIRDAAVARKTGAGWSEWFARIDRSPAAKGDHAAIVRWLRCDHSPDAWWSQMVTVEWERARGRRVKNQTATGFRASVSRTLPAEAAALWRWITVAADRRRWLIVRDWKVAFEKRAQRLRLAWSDGSEVEFQLVAKAAAKGRAKCQLVVEQRQMKDAKAVGAAKACWRRAVDRLEELVAARRGARDGRRRRDGRDPLPLPGGARRRLRRRHPDAAFGASPPPAQAGRPRWPSAGWGRRGTARFDPVARAAAHRRFAASRRVIDGGGSTTIGARSHSSPRKPRPP